MKEQQNNRTNNRRITHNGETHTLQQWSEITGNSPDIIAWRITQNWPLERAIFQPARHMTPRKAQTT